MRETEVEHPHPGGFSCHALLPALAILGHKHVYLASRRMFWNENQELSMYVQLLLLHQLPGPSDHGFPDGQAVGT